MHSPDQSLGTPASAQNSPICSWKHDPEAVRIIWARPRQDGDFRTVRAVFSVELFGALRLQNCLLLTGPNGALKVQHPAVGVTLYGRELRRVIRDAVLLHLQRPGRTQ